MLKHSSYAHLGRLLLTSMLLVALSTLAVAQLRYTVNRPILRTTQTYVQPAPPSNVQDDTVPDGAVQDDKMPEVVFTPQHSVPISWETDFEYAKRTAELSARCLLIYLYADHDQDIPLDFANLPIIPACRNFETVVLDDTFVRAGLDWFVPLKLPMDALITDEDGIEQSIYTLPGFEHMLGYPGLVVMDFARRDMPYYGEVVGILPFLHGDSPNAKQTDVFLNLPPGTLTQRTLTYAVRIHPDKPLSSDGIPAPIVVQLSTEHAVFQAERGILGHHNFGVRSYQAKAVLGGGMPSEICAQSRPGLGLFEGAISCMRAWRNSSAHWVIARKYHTYYGYDMTLGRNGAWYAVGFFIH